MNYMYEMTEEEICKMFDSGMFNDIARGFMIRCMQELTEISDKDIKDALNESSYVFDMCTAKRFLEVYKKWK